MTIPYYCDYLIARRDTYSGLAMEEAEINLSFGPIFDFWADAYSLPALPVGRTVITIDLGAIGNPACVDLAVFPIGTSRINAQHGLNTYCGVKMLTVNKTLYFMKTLAEGSGLTGAVRAYENHRFAMRFLNNDGSSFNRYWNGSSFQTAAGWTATPFYYQNAPNAIMFPSYGSTMYSTFLYTTVQSQQVAVEGFWLTQSGTNTIFHCAMQNWGGSVIASQSVTLGAIGY